MALNFPTTDLFNGKTYTGDNGVTYTYQDGKWIGSGVVSSTISDHLHHGSFNLTLNDDGTVQFPNYKFPVADGTNGQTLKTNGSGILTWHADNANNGPSIGDMVFAGNTMNNLNGIIVQNYATGHAATAAVILPVNGNQNNPVEINNTTANVRIGVGPSIVNQWTFGVDSKLTIPGYLITPYGEIRQSSIGDSGMAIDALPSQGITVSSNGLAHKWHFAADGNLTLPTGGAVNYANGHSILEGIGGGGGGGPSLGNYTFSGNDMTLPNNARLNGGHFLDNSPEFGTTATINVMQVMHSEIYMGAGTAESRAIVDNEGRGLMYLGVENVGEGKFAGIVARDPNDDGSQYSPGINEDGLPTIGPGSNSYSVAVGVMNDGFTINGVFADETQTVVASGAHAWRFDPDGDVTVPGQIRNAQGYRAIWSSEVPRDISDLTDNSMLLGVSGSTMDINIDGGGAYVTYEGTLVRADGGFSGTRWGVNTTIFDGGLGAAGAGYTATLNGGGA